MIYEIRRRHLIQKQTITAIARFIVVKISNVEIAAGE
jgi:hypothetical protein